MKRESTRYEPAAAVHCSSAASGAAANVTDWRVDVAWWVATVRRSPRRRWAPSFQGRQHET